MAAQTWATLQTTLLAATVKSQPPYTVAPADFAALFPQATSYAEGRIFHDIPFLGNKTTNTSLTTTAGIRTVDTSAMINSLGGPIIIPEGFALITPSGSVPPAGVRVPYDLGTSSLIDQFWPSETTTIAPSLTDYVNPRFWTYKDNTTAGFAPKIIYAPTADNVYTVEITGLFQPTPISATQQQTYLSVVYPELLEAACMVFIAGWLLHNYGATSGNPQMSVTHETQYQTLLVGIRAEEARRRGLTPDEPPPPTGARA